MIGKRTLKGIMGHKNSMIDMQHHEKETAPQHTNK